MDAIWEVSVGNMGRITYVFEVQTSGSIDSLLLNLMKAKNNPSVQGIVAVSDAKQLEKIKKEASSLKAIRDELKYWDYNDVLKVFDSLSNAYESINSLEPCSIGAFLISPPPCGKTETECTCVHSVSVGKDGFEPPKA